MMHSRACGVATHLAILLFVPTLVWSQPDEASAEYRTVMRGVQHREASLTSISGDLAHGSWFVGADGDRDNALFLVRFLVADARLSYEATGLLAGPNVWGVLPGVEGPFFRLPGRDDLYHNGLGPSVQVAMDGTYQYEYASPLNQGFIRSQQDAFDLAATPPLAEFLMLGFSGCSYGEALERSAQIPGGRYLGEDIYLGETCHVVSVVADKKADSVWHVAMWVCPAFSWAVVRVESVKTEVSSGRLTQARVRKGRDFSEIAEGIWLPAYVECHEYRYTTQDAASPWVATDVIELSNLRANVPIEAGDFVYEFPPGAIVMNEITGDSSYLHGAAVGAIREEWERRGMPPGEAGFSAQGHSPEWLDHAGE